MTKNNFIFSLTLATIFLLVTITSCSVTDEVPVMLTPCQEDNALMTKQKAPGAMIYLMCYDAWAVKLHETNVEGSHLIAASIDIDDAYKIDNLEVTLDACLYEFDLELLFPDPAPWGDLYVMREFLISKY